MTLKQTEEKQLEAIQVVRKTTGILKDNYFLSLVTIFLNYEPTFDKAIKALEECPLPSDEASLDKYKTAAKDLRTIAGSIGKARLAVTNEIRDNITKKFIEIEKSMREEADKSMARAKAIVLEYQEKVELERQEKARKARIELEMKREQEEERRKAFQAKTNSLNNWKSIWEKQIEEAEDIKFLEEKIEALQAFQPENSKYAETHLDMAVAIKAHLIELARKLQIEIQEAQANPDVVQDVEFEDVEEEEGDDSTWSSLFDDNDFQAPEDTAEETMDMEASLTNQEAITTARNNEKELAAEAARLAELEKEAEKSKIKRKLTGVKIKDHKKAAELYPELVLLVSDAKLRTFARNYIGAHQSEPDPDAFEIQYTLDTAL